MAVFFHGSFGLNRHYMSGILKAALDNPALTDEQLSKPFGYKAPFAAKYRTWLHKTGITELRRPLRLTQEGSRIWGDDPDFDKESTMWFMHRELTTDPTRAEAWHFFFNEFLPDNPEFDKGQLEMAIMKAFRSHSEKHFGPMSKMNPIIANKLVQCYLLDSALGKLNLLQQLDASFRFNPNTRP